MIKLIYLVIVVANQGGGATTIPAPFTGPDALTNCQAEIPQIETAFATHAYCITVTRDRNGNEY